MSLPVYDPSECYELSNFGFGPFPVSGGVAVCPPNPLGSGYGGSVYDEGGDPYGLGPYGSSPDFPRPPFPVDGGYGGDPYGLGPYGGGELIPPGISAIISLDGSRVEVFFTEDMDINSVLLDPSSYSLVAITGAADASVISVSVGTTGSAGATSIILTHSGTTLGGIYELTITGPTDISGNPIEGSGDNVLQFIALGDPATFTVTAISGSELLLQFSSEMLAESVFSGIEQASNYDISSGYPVVIAITAIEHPYGGDASQVLLTVQGMTTVEYTALISPATAIDYDGSYLPDTSVDFNGSEVGTGTSSISGGALSLSKNIGDTYGWNFEDISGKVLPNSSFRVDLEFDASLASYTPALFDAVLGAFYVNDGAVQVALILERVAGNDTLTILSGAYSKSVSANWSSASSVLSLVRNQQADTYTVLFNGTPLDTALTASFTGVPTIPSGCQFLLGATYTLSNFFITDISFTSTQTIFNSSWNFLHNQSFVFTGSGALAKSSLLTQKGPLTKGWGDATPATKNDVSVFVDGTEVSVASVNPYLGEIVLDVPIPLMPAGSITVTVDYFWFPVPTFEMTGFNTPGLVFNKWDLPSSLQYPAYGSDPLGALDTESRFPMRLVLGPVDRPQPKLISHRFIAFDKAYTSSFNSPTTLLFNQDPHAISVEDFNKSPLPFSASFEGTESPLGDWSLEGVDTGSADPLTGIYTLIDASSGSFGEGTGALYYQDANFSCPTSVSLAARFRITDYTLDGVYTGVGFGLHTNRRLILVGALLINGVEHIGILKDGFLPEKLESWEIGPSTTAQVVDSLNFTMSTSAVPLSLEIGDRFQILSGPQAGVYLIDCFVEDPLNPDVTTVTLNASTPFPENPRFWGNDTGEILFESKWSDSLVTYRLSVNTDTGASRLYVSGEISSVVVDLAAIPETPFAAQSNFLFSTEGEGQVFWGSFGRIPTNTSEWSFFRYGATPERQTFHSRGIIVSSEMDSLPENDTNSEWFITNNFGYSEVDSSGQNLLLKSTSADFGFDLSFGYSRIEAFFNPDHHIDFDGEFKVESESLGFGDASVVIEDTFREIRFGTILYLESGGERKLINLPSQSLSGLFVPENQAWISATGNTLTASSRGQILTTVQSVNRSGTWYQDLDLTNLPFVDEGGRIIEARFAVTSFTANGSGETGIIFGAESGVLATAKIVALTLLDANGGDPERVALTSNGTPIQTYDFDWTDGEPHTYRILVDAQADTVTLVIDDTVQIPTIALSSFDSAATNTMVFLGGFNLDVASTVEWDSFHCVVKAPSTAKRTLGVWLGGSLDDINNFALPRTDSLSVPNSSLSAVVEEMDWRSDTQFRIHRDGAWGVVVLRPDLPPPPFYVPGQFATEITEPSAGWISVEYAKLPIKGNNFGQVFWGSLDSRSITQQRWDYVRYRIYNTVSEEDYIAPQNMVFNRANVITSAEFLKDTTPEIAIINSLTANIISLRPADIYAKQVFKVLEDNVVIPYDSWEFDAESQSIILDTPLSGDVVPVTVIFSVAHPITKTYLENQPLDHGMTLLNDGTPPFQKHQHGDSTPTSTAGSLIYDPNDPDNPDADFIDNSNYNFLLDSDNPDHLYECLEFCTVDDGGEENLLTSLCDDTYCGKGLVEMTFGGDGSDLFFYEVFKTPKNSFYPLPPLNNPGSGSLSIGNIIGGSPAALGSPYVSPTYSTIYWSGGNFQDGTFGPGTSLFYPNYRSQGVRPGTQPLGVNTTVTFGMTLESVVIDELGNEASLEETLTLSATADNTPPSFSTDPNQVPNGTPGTNNNGACLATLETPAEYSRFGPWGGITSLEPSSLLAGVSASQPFGIPASGAAFTFAGGSPLPLPTTTVINIESAN